MIDHSLYKLLEQERIAHKTIREDLEKRTGNYFLLMNNLKKLIKILRN